jgi:hypothetical protein
VDQLALWACLTLWARVATYTLMGVRLSDLDVPVLSGLGFVPAVGAAVRRFAHSSPDS